MSHALIPGNRKSRKALLIDCVLGLWDEGERSPTLIAEACGISKAYAAEILAVHNRRKAPRRDLRDTLSGVSPALRAKIARLHIDPVHRTPFGISQAKRLKPA